MIDEIYDRAYQNGREELHAGIRQVIRRAVRGTAVAFTVLNRIEWSAPWDHAQLGRALTRKRTLVKR